MAESPRTSSVRSNRRSTAGIPRWVKAFVIAFVVLVVVFVILHLTGHGFSDHLHMSAIERGGRLR